MALASINSHPTFSYSQPDEYRFSHDSVFLARRVFEFLEEHNRKPQTAIDICAGCGIIGMDLLFHLRAAGNDSPLIFDFLEIQKQYEPHFHENLNRLDVTTTQCRFINGNYANIQSPNLQAKYDLMVCNPPYFSIQHGKLPTADLKLRSRFFVDSDLETLINFIHQKLSPIGLAFVLIRNQLEHKQDQIASVRKLCEDKLHVNVMEDVRGTDLAMLSLTDVGRV